MALYLNIIRAISDHIKIKFYCKNTDIYMSKKKKARLYSRALMIGLLVYTVMISDSFFLNNSSTFDENSFVTS